MRAQIAAGVYSSYQEMMAEAKEQSHRTILNKGKDPEEQEWAGELAAMYAIYGSAQNENPLLPISHAITLRRKRSEDILWLGRVDSDTLIASSPYALRPIARMRTDGSIITEGHPHSKFFSRPQVELLAQHAITAFMHPDFPADTATRNLGQQV